MKLKDFQKMDRYEAHGRILGPQAIDAAAARRALKGPIGPDTQRRITNARRVVSGHANSR